MLRQRARQLYRESTSELSEGESSSGKEFSRKSEKIFTSQYYEVKASEIVSFLQNYKLYFQARN